MKKIILLFIFCLFCFCSSQAQQGEWVWLHGDSIGGSPGTYGTQGTASPANEPAGMYEPCKWTDTSGNFWLYGGYNVSGDYLNDLWKYDPLANEWTWVSGTHTLNDAGNYGTEGVPSPANSPPSRALAPVGWVDQNNNLWMFGGGNNNSGFSIYNDLWEYSIANNEWTWMKGSNVSFAAGIYGVKGTANISNTPGARAETATSWTDNAGDLWFFGGFNLAGDWNDLWRFHVASNSWTWMNGSATAGATVKYGTKGIETAANTPGGTWAYSSWKDATGNLWFWGGVGTDSDTIYGGLNDLWRYNTVTNNWTWMNGDANASQKSRFGTKCAPDSSNVPGGRYENRAAWTDANGNFWTFGGLTDPGFNLSNDLWMYCLAKNEWIWISGDSLLNPPGLWGMKGVASPFNKPNGRAGSVGWTDNKGHLYLFGGEFAESNDLWEYTIDNACSSCSVALPVAAFQSSDSVFCANACANFTDLSTNATSWQWIFQGGSPSSSSLQNPQYICYTISGNYNVTLIASNPGGSDTLTVNDFITVHPAPPTPVIMQRHDTLYCSTDTSYSAYQWFDSATIIPGATDTFLVVPQNGNYNLQVTSHNGCKTATGINVTVGIEDFTVNSLLFTISPNPVGKELRIVSQDFEIEEIEIYNILGAKIYSDKFQSVNYKSGILLNVSSLPSGIYVVRVTNKNGSRAERFVHD